MTFTQALCLSPEYRAVFFVRNYTKAFYTVILILLLSCFQLFDFDIEVKPILEVLVGKTVEQALLEVMEEEELSNLRAQQRRFEELRNAELVETQRLEEQERRRREEKERRMKQQADVLQKEKETGEKIAARAFAQVNVVSLFEVCSSKDRVFTMTLHMSKTTFHAHSLTLYNRIYFT